MAMHLNPINRVKNWKIDKTITNERIFPFPFWNVFFNCFSEWRMNFCVSVCALKIFFCIHDSPLDPIYLVYSDGEGEKIIAALYLLHLLMELWNWWWRKIAHAHLLQIKNGKIRETEPKKHKREGEQNRSKSKWKI